MKQAYGIPVQQTLEDVCDPSRLALLVYDMQVGIVSQLKGSGPVSARVAQVLEAARHAGVRTFFTRHMSLPRELMGAFQYRMAMAWQRLDDPAKVQPWFLRDSPGFAIVPELTPRPSEAIFDKLAMSAFEGTPWRWRCATAVSPRSLLSASQRKSASSRPRGTRPISVSSRSSSPTPAVPVTRRQHSARWNR